MSVSVDGKHIVLFTDAGVLWMGSSDFQVVDSHSNSYISDSVWIYLFFRKFNTFIYSPQEKYCEFNTANGSRPKQLMWCCDSIASNSIANGLMPKNNIAVVIYRPKTILVVGPSKDWVKYTVEEDFKSQLGSAVLCPDVDGVHIVTANKHEFLQHVPGMIGYDMFVK